MTARLGAILLALLMVSIGGCRGDDAVSTPTPPVAAPAPRSNPTAPPPTDRLGSLPPGVGVAVGLPAPDATLHDSNGVEVSLADLLARGPTALVFYRGGWCPYCNFQIRELTAAWPELAARGVGLVAVSVDRVEEAAKTAATYTIPFPVLSDPDLSAHRAFRVVHHADDAEVARLEGFGIDVARSSGRDHHDFAIPAVFVIDRAGVVRWAHADPDYKVRPSTSQILAAIDALAPDPAPPTSTR